MKIKNSKPFKANSTTPPTDNPVLLPSLPSKPSSRTAQQSSTQRRLLARNDSLSQASLVDLGRCNHQRFWNSMSRSLRRYLSCLKPTTEPIRSKDEGKGSFKLQKCNVQRKMPQRNCNYYSEMDAEDRDEKIKSAINYCKDSMARS